MPAGNAEFETVNNVGSCANGNIPFTEIELNPEASTNEFDCMVSNCVPGITEKP
jgi:hypothetical protein